MNDFDAEKEKEVELLRNSIDQLKTVQLKLEATAKAAKERKQKTQQNALDSHPVAAVQVETTGETQTTAPELVASDTKKPSTPVPETLAAKAAVKVDEHIEIDTVVESLKLSEDGIPKEEFHGIHSK